MTKKVKAVATCFWKQTIRKPILMGIAFVGLVGIILWNARLHSVVVKEGMEEAKADTNASSESEKVPEGPVAYKPTPFLSDGKTKGNPRQAAIDKQRDSESTQSNLNNLSR